ncbi:MAG: gliding motility lipoprotein GldH [Bacteroidales bacterium]|nr:gliding motility lipoprotein GldH [Bacteroidales bacterium]MCM1148306.1 gliding motility lipoprotein GldH [Bacteroidales bacterium]MCM1206510.1 gliding motility lipoprotein GldH [Bacillota bacterium]MCM1510397.1 gliding motility lipoprotein GldH [Clostridium sp.]
MTRHSVTLLSAILCATLSLTACDDRRIYDHYEHTAVGGWEKNDALAFSISPLKKSGRYTLSLGLRTSDAYPFKNLSLVVEQTSFPSRQKAANVVNCNIVNRNGRRLGNGITLYQYSIPIRKKFHMRGDSLHITVRHNMKREILPGIVDIGIRMDND